MLRLSKQKVVIERYEEITVYQDRSATGGSKDKNGEKYDVM